MMIENLIVGALCAFYSMYGADNPYEWVAKSTVLVAIINLGG